VLVCDPALLLKRSSRPKRVALDRLLIANSAGLLLPKAGRKQFSDCEH